MIRPTLMSTLGSLNCFQTRKVKVELRTIGTSSVSSPPKLRKSDKKAGQKWAIDETTIESLMAMLLPPLTIEAECPIHRVTSDPVSLHSGVPRVIYDLMGGAASIGISPWSALNNDDGQSSTHLNPWAMVEPALRVLVYQAQVQGSMWRRNGLAVAQQIAFYRHNGESCHQFELDLLAVQMAFIAPGVSADKLLLQILDKFELVPWLSNNSCTELRETNSWLKSVGVLLAYGTALIDEFLLLLINILTERYRPGVGENIKQRDYVRNKLIQRLSTGAQPHSHLREQILSHNDDADAEGELDELLSELTDTRNRPTDGRTLFDLKPNALEEFNPFTIFLERSEAARAEQHVRDAKRRFLSGKIPVLILPSHLPPFSDLFSPLLSMLTSPLFLEILRIVLFKALIRETTLHQDSHVEKVLFILAIIAVEQRRSGSLSGEVRFHEIPEAALVLQVLKLLNKANEGEGFSSNQTQANELTSTQRDLVTWLIAELLPDEQCQSSTSMEPLTADESSDKLTQATKQKSMIAQQHRNKLMAKMAKLQRSFLDSHPELANINQGGAASSAGNESTPSAMETDEDTDSIGSFVQMMFDSCKESVCMVCQDACPPAVVSPLTSASQQHIMVPGGSGSESNSPSVSCFVSTIQRCYSLSQKQSTWTQQPPSLFLSVCGHPIHAYCWNRYTESQQARPRHRFLPGVLNSLFGNDTRSGQALIAPCPLCESLGNSVIPLVDMRNFLPLPSNSSHSQKQELEKLQSVLADACKLIVTIGDADEREYQIVSSHRTSQTLTSPYSGTSGNSVAKALTIYSSSISSNVIRQISSQSISYAHMKPPSSPDDVRFIAMAVSHTCRCIASIVLTFNPADITDQDGNFSGAVRRHVDCLVAACQAGVATSLLGADSFCAVNILRVVSANFLSRISEATESDTEQFTAPSVTDTGELLAHLWLLEPLVRTGLQDKESSRFYTIDSFWLCFLLEVAKVLINSCCTNELKPGGDDADPNPPADGSLVAAIWKAVFVEREKLPSEMSLKLVLKDSVTAFVRQSSLLSSAILNRPLSVNAFLNTAADLKTLCRDATGVPFSKSPLDMLFDDPIKSPFNVPNQYIVKATLTRLCLFREKTDLVKPNPSARRMVTLPVNYSHLLARSSKFVCPSADDTLPSASAVSSGQQPVLCLLCDTMVCGATCEHCINRLGVGIMGQESTVSGKTNPLVEHALACSGGRGVFLRLHDCCLLLAADATGRVIKYPSVFTDKFGEPDPGLRRGCPLILSKQRYAEVERLWLGHGLADAAYKYFASGRSAAADLIFAGVNVEALQGLGFDPAGIL